ncbi:MAG TPA: S8 family serine peptidase [Vicinamibacterales bacterium]|jgi:serine protease AprX|nr:S8 family serine peptidase [Vicinamibacterales bacterium]
MSRRPLFFIAVILCLLTGLPAHPAGQRRPTLSGDLANVAADRIRLIVQPASDGDLGSIRGRLRGVVRRELQGAVALEVSRAEFDAMSRDSAFAHISADAVVVSDMAITNKVTGASAMWQGSGGLLGLLATPGYNGSGIGVAVVDSGIAPHSALDSRVIARVNLVSWEGPTTGDPYGHGTHVAGIIGGNTTAPKYVTTAFAGGSAPGVNLIDVRVLGATGVGYTSDVIAGIDWAIANRTRYGIRVINLSLGHAVSEPAAIDPLCQAVARAVQAGVVVVASAGNYGVTSSGAPVLGGITSPGNSPFAITVGAIDTAGTVTRSDDTVAAYSSKGPTRYDLAVKPDVVAPGTRIVSLEAQGSYLSKNYPSWHIAGSAKNSYFRLTGTSMATAVVSGGVALLLDANPFMTPGQVKVALQMGATFMPNGGLVGAGSGLVNFPQSQKIATTGLVASLLNTVDGLLGTSSGATFRDTGTMIDRIYDRTGVRLLGLVDLSVLFVQADSSETGVLNLLGLNNPIAQIPANHVVWGDVADWTNNYHVVWGDSIRSPSGQHVVWGDMEHTDSNHVVWGDAAVGGGH